MLIKDLASLSDSSCLSRLHPFLHSYIQITHRLRHAQLCCDLQQSGQSRTPACLSAQAVISSTCSHLLLTASAATKASFAQSVSSLFMKQVSVSFLY